MRAILAALIICALACSPVHAQTADEIAACKPDAIRLCKPQLEGWFVTVRVFKCMREHRLELSPRCDAVFRAHGL